MNIIVCVKAVSSQLVPNESTNQERIVLNPYDTYALKKACCLKKRYGGTVTCISMGITQAEDTLRKCISIGADKAILLNDIEFSGADTLSTTYVLAYAINKIRSYDLIICGRQTVDGDTGQVGPGLATRLKIPYITNVEECDLNEQNKLVCTRILEVETQEIELKMPALITFNNFDNIVSSLSIAQIKKSQRAIIDIWKSSDLDVEKFNCGKSGSMTRVVNSYSPIIEVDGVTLEGTIEDRCDKLFNLVSVLCNV